ncbi:phosphohistidine phosphatase SixA [Pseudomonas sp. MWU16-30317]|uniref:phosphohistidine phosphatase SixA n=1 Tax=Pseudomonas sp. MWU16-30317 TaxID=2878095 RepID=UPI001CFBB4D0|nr:phosphohistidine phosphatase SixA [Pseudomonas sp. MWU16-30317]
MKLWVLRHGEAHHQAPTDAERELTEAGRAEVLRSAAHLQGLALDAIYASPYVRAQQTAKLVRDALGHGEPIRTVAWLTPDQSPSAVITQLEAIKLENILLVSHQPLVSTLLGLLDNHEHHMGTASLAELDGEWPLAGLMTLKSLRHA